jgi:hypothetical protein
VGAASAAAATSASTRRSYGLALRRRRSARLSLELGGPTPFIVFDAISAGARVVVGGEPLRGEEFERGLLRADGARGIGLRARGRRFGIDEYVEVKVVSIGVGI